jgi:hypothetical protein
VSRSGQFYRLKDNLRKESLKSKQLEEQVKIEKLKSSELSLKASDVSRMLESERESLHNQYQRLQTELTLEKEKYESQQKEARLKYDEVKNAVENTNSKLKEQSQRSTILKTENEKLKRSLQSTKDEKEQLKVQYAKEQCDHDNTKLREVRLTDEKSKLSETLDSMKNQNDKRNDELVQLKKEIQSIQGQLHDCKVELASYKDPSFGHDGSANRFRSYPRAQRTHWLQLFTDHCKALTQCSVSRVYNCRIIILFFDLLLVSLRELILQVIFVIDINNIINRYLFLSSLQNGSFCTIIII